MSRGLIRRASLLMVLVVLLGGTVVGQSAKSKTAPAKPTAKAEPAKAQPASKPATVASDIKIRTKYTSGAQVSENTTYVKGARQRVEFPGVISIDQCDLGRTLVLNVAAKTYLVNAHAAADAAAPANASTQGATVQQATAGQAPNAAPPKGGVVTYTTTLTDTGERKQLFGREARHITTVMTKEASPNACDKSAVTIEMDAWYIDFPPIARCPVASAPPRSLPRAEPCVDRIEMRGNGEAKLGFPLAMMTKTTVGEGDKREAITSSMEVTAFETTTLDPALFDVPAGFTEARTNAELMSAFQSGGGLNEALLGSTADGTSTAAPKSAGAIRIGVLEPVDKSSHNLPTRELRQQLAGNFGKAPFEALTLSGSSAAESQGEAARMECDYVLYSEITDIKTSKPGKVGGLLKKVSRDGPARDVHEVKLDYKLYAVGAAGTTAPAFGDTTKASSGGGFDIHSAVRLAMAAGSLYLRFTGLGLLNPMLASNFGGLGPLARSGLFDPRMSAMSSMTELMTSSGVEAIGGNSAMTAMRGAAGTGESEAEIRQTVDTALTNAAKSTMEQLRKNRK